MMESLNGQTMEIVHHIRFSAGPVLREGPAPWGHVREWRDDKPAFGKSDAHLANLQCRVDFPAPVTAAHALAAAEALVSTHHALRCTYGETPTGELLMRLRAAEIHHVEGPLEQPSAVIAFDLQADIPLRIDLYGTREKELHHAVFTVHHVASDATGLDVLKADFIRLVAAQVTAGGHPADPVPPTPPSPLDYAVRERSEERGRAIARARAYWQGMSAAAPSSIYPGRTYRRKDARSAVVHLTSHRLKCAVAELTRRQTAMVGGIVLAAYAIAVERNTGCDFYPVQVFSNNRFDARARAMVACLVQPAVVGVRPEYGVPVSSFLSRCDAELAKAYRWSHFDPDEIEKIWAQEETRRSRPLPIERFINVTIQEGASVTSCRHHGAPCADGSTAPQIAYSRPGHSGPEHNLRVIIHDDSVKMRLVHDSTLVDREMAEHMLADVEEAIVACAAAADSPLGDAFPGISS